MAPEDTSNQERSRTPTESALVLLAIYLALYLGVAGLVHILTLPHANAAVRQSVSIAPASVVAPERLPADTPEPAKAATDPKSESTSDPRACKPGNPFDSNCMYD